MPGNFSTLFQSNSLLREYLYKKIYHADMPGKMFQSNSLLREYLYINNFQNAAPP